MDCMSEFKGEPESLKSEYTNVFDGWLLFFQIHGTLFKLCHLKTHVSVQQTSDSSRGGNVWSFSHQFLCVGKGSTATHVWLMSPPTDKDKDCQQVAQV